MWSQLEKVRSNLKDTAGKLVDAASTVLYEDEEEDDPRELEIYKELLAKAQSEQIKITREYQKLVKEQQLKIRDLENMTTRYDTDVKTKTTSSSSSSSSFDEEMEKIVAEHELRLKDSMLERNDAIVKYEKTRKDLEMKIREAEKYKALSDRLEHRTEKMTNAQRENESTYEADMERLVAEYSKLVTSSSEKEGIFKRQISELRSELLDRRPELAKTSKNNEEMQSFQDTLSRKTLEVTMLENKFTMLKTSEQALKDLEHVLRHELRESNQNSIQELEQSSQNAKEHLESSLLNERENARKEREKYKLEIQSVKRLNESHLQNLEQKLKMNHDAKQQRTLQNQLETARKEQEKYRLEIKSEKDLNKSRLQKLEQNLESVETSRNAKQEYLESSLQNQIEITRKEQEKYRLEIVSERERIEVSLRREHTLHLEDAQSRHEDILSKTRLEHESQLHQLNERLKKSKNELLEEQREASNRLKIQADTNHSNQLKQLRHTHENELQEIKRKHRQDTQELRQRHEIESQSVLENMSAMKSQSQQEIQMLQESRDEELRNLRNAHELSQRRNHAEHEDIMRKKITEYSDRNRISIENLETQHEQMVTKLHREHRHNMATIKEEQEQIVLSSRASLEKLTQNHKEMLEKHRVQAQEKLSKMRSQISTLESNHQHKLVSMNKSFESEKQVLRQEIEQEAARRENAIRRVREEIHVEIAQAEERVRKELQDRVEEAHTKYVIPLCLLTQLLTLNHSYHFHTIRYAEESKRRREVHNKLIELQGNIRVFCRVRPIIELEKKRDVEGMVNCIEFPVESDVIVRENLRAHRYEFDAVFSPGTNQGDVFRCIEDTIVSVVDGYNVCIFAYVMTHID